MGIELGKTTGKINLTNVSGNIELNNNNGNVDLTNEKENIELNGVSGDIELVIKGGGSSVEIDDTLSIAGAAADAAATGEALGTIKDELTIYKDELTSYDEGAMVSATNLTPETKVNLKVKSKNEFDISGIALGKSIYGGSVGDTVYRLNNKADCATHPYVPVKPSTHYVFSLDNTNYWVSRICEMDENDLTIRNHGYYNTSSDFSVKSFITKETTKYLYIQFKNKNGEEATLEGLEATHFQLEIGDTPTLFTPYVDVANREIKVIGKNILNGDNGIGASDFENKEIGAKMPTEFIAGKNQIHPYIPVKPDTYYTFSFQAARGLGWQSYMVKEIFEADENDVIVARYLFDESHNKYTFKTTPTTKYILVSIALINGSSVSNAGYQLRIRDFQLEEGKDESATDFYYEETYTTDENGLIEGITFPRTELNAYPIDKGLIIELEVEEVEQIEVDTTLSQPGAAADAKATGDAIGKLEAKETPTTTRYFVNMDEFKNKGIMAVNVNHGATDSNNYRLRVEVVLAASIYQNGAFTYLTDIPFEYLYYSGIICNNIGDFKQFGIKGAAIEQTVGTSDTIWFTAFTDLLGNSGFSDCRAYLTCDGNHGVGEMKFRIEAISNNYPLVVNIQQLFQQVFNAPGNTLVIDYQKPVIEEEYNAQCLYDALPILEA